MDILLRKQWNNLDIWIFCFENNGIIWTFGYFASKTFGHMDTLKDKEEVLAQILANVICFFASFHQRPYFTCMGSL
jgi:hypothetical protein